MNLKKKLERYLPVNLLGPGPHLIKKKNLSGCGLTKVEKHIYTRCHPWLYEWPMWMAFR